LFPMAGWVRVLNLRLRLVRAVQARAVYQGGLRSSLVVVLVLGLWSPITLFPILVLVPLARGVSLAGWRLFLAAVWVQVRCVHLIQAICFLVCLGWGEPLAALK